MSPRKGLEARVNSSSIGMNLKEQAEAIGHLLLAVQGKSLQDYTSQKEKTTAKRSKGHSKSKGNSNGRKTAKQKQSDPLKKIDVVEYQSTWLDWNSVRHEESGTYFSFREGFLPMLAAKYSSEYQELLDVCKQNGSYSVHNLASLLSTDLRSAVEQSLNLNYDPKSVLGQIQNEGLGTKLQDFLLGRYGLDKLGENAIDMADLLHAAYFSKFDAVKDTHIILRELGSYLSSSNRRGGRDSLHSPPQVDLDSVLAFFNSYDDQAKIEEILYQIEKRKIFDALAEVTKPHSKNAKKYEKVLASTLDSIIKKQSDERATSQFEGSKRILSRLIDHYEELNTFELDGIPNNLNGWAFPRFYQAETVQSIYREKRFLVAHEMGTGKTAIGALASQYIQQQEKKKGNDFEGSFKTLIITTSTNKHGITEKIHEYLPDASVSLVNGGKRDYATIAESDFVVINYELLRALDWKKEDFMTWELDSESLNLYTQQIHQKYEISGRLNKSEEDKLAYVKSHVRKQYRDSLTTLDEAYLAYAKQQDLNNAQSVAINIQQHLNPNHVIADEIQNARKSTSLNAKAIKKITEHAEYVTCLSGTPFVNGLSDLNVICELLGIYDSMVDDQKEKVELARNSGLDKITIQEQEKTLTHLERAVQRGDIKEILLSNPRMVRDYLRPKMSRIGSTQALDLPELHMHPKTPDKYSELLHLNMHSRLVYQILQSHNFGNSSDQLRALQMFLLSPGLYKKGFEVAPGTRGKSGNAPIIPKNLDHLLSDESSVKYTYLKKIVKKVVSQRKKKKKNIMIFSSLYRRHVTQELEARFKKEFPKYDVLRIDGTVTDTPKNRARTNTLQRFNNADKPTLLFVTGYTMKEAIEADQQCSTQVHLDFPFTWADYSQSVARVWRGRQNEEVDIYNFMISNSLDIGKWNLLQAKKELGTLLLEGAPLKKKELEKLDMTDANAESSGFISSFIRKNQRNTLQIMRDLHGSGKKIAMHAIGKRSARSEVYADGYLLNTLSDASLKSIYHDILDTSGITFSELKSLDGTICDLAAGYGKFSHSTGIATHNLEVNPVIIERAKQFVASGTEYTHGAMQDIRKIYGDEQFDHVIHSLSFHYASDEERGQLLFDIHATLRDGGYLYITEPTGSINAKGCDSLVSALEHTGYDIILAGEMSVDKRKFFKVIAQKSDERQLYETPFPLRTYTKRGPIDPDEIRVENKAMRTQFASEQEGVYAPVGQWIQEDLK